MIDPGSRKVLDLARAILGDLDVEAVLARVLDSARELADARYAALGVLDRDGTGLARFLTSGIDSDVRERIGPLPRGRGVLGELIREPVPLRLTDVEEHPRSYGFPLGHPPMHTFLGVPITIGAKPFGNIYLTEKRDGRPFSEDDEATLLLLAEFAGLAIDHARRYGDSEGRRKDLQHKVNALDATVQIARTLAGQTDLDLILGLVAKRGRALVSARSLVIELIDGQDLLIAAGAGVLPEGGLIGKRTAIENSVAGAALQTLVSQRLEGDLNRVRFAAHGLGNLGLTAEAGLVVPLVLGGRKYGALVAIDRQDGGPEFSAEDEELLEAFAASAATAVATAQSMATERREQRLAATEQERGRWARELHDGTLQNLAALKLGLAAGRQAEDPALLAAAAGQAIEGLESEIAEIHSLITELRPTALDAMGTEAALEALAERTRRGGIAVDLKLDLAYEEGRFSDRHTPELETAIYRIVQEALTNAAKHGDATTVLVEATEGQSVVRLTVRDDGDGFQPGASTEGFGLAGMRERAEILSGGLEIKSAPGRGTSITATLPVQRRARRAAVTRAGASAQAGRERSDRQASG
jgi:signal transduction histidine kinase